MTDFQIFEHEYFIKISFHAPESSNALSLKGARELAKIQRSLRKSQKPVLFVSEHPRLFCAGGNLTDYKKLSGKAPGLKINREITKILDEFARWPCLKLAVIEGDALGGGMEFLARFDFRWSTPSSLFAFWQKRIGLTPGWGGGKAWAKIIGEQKLRQLLIEARLLSATEALRFGLVDRVVSSWDIREQAEKWLVALAQKGDLKPWLAWTAAGEASAFSNLWMEKAHRDVLKRWK